MKILGDDIYLQKGESLSLDFELKNEKGAPYTLLRKLRNPYLVITVSSALYEQGGNFRQNYWLDLSSRLEEQEDGTLKSVPIKRFTSTEALYLDIDDPADFSVNEVLATYGRANGGKIVVDLESDYDVSNFLFFMSNDNGERVYKYLESYIPGPEENEISDEVWKEYSLRVVKSFDTRSWKEQQYYYDIKILAGIRFDEYLKEKLRSVGIGTLPLPWNNEMIDSFVALLEKNGSNLGISEDEISLIREVYRGGEPLMPFYDTKIVLLNPTKIFVGVDLQGG